jgi:pimeloyl-ACP methyl ester carboxylesterase
MRSIGACSILKKTFFLKTVENTVVLFNRLASLSRLMKLTFTVNAQHMKKLLTLLPVLLIFFTCHKKTSTVLLERGGVQIAYNKSGTGDTTLFFVHGWCINKEYWQQQIKFFSPRYTVVAIDLPGFGQSGKLNSSWNFGEYTEDVKTVIEQLHLNNVILVGHSMSGDILLDVSNRYPKMIIGIIGIDNLHEPAGEMTEKQKEEADDFFSLFSSRFDSVVASSMNQYLFQPTTDTAVKQRVMQNILNADSLTAVQVLKSLTFYSQYEKPRMKKLNHKLYLINSDVAPVKADSLTKYCAKGYEVVYVNGTGHYPMIEKPEEFNNALQVVIDKIFLPSLSQQ